MVTMESADQALKSYYLGAITEQLNTKINPFFAAIKQSSANVMGKNVVRSVRYGVNGGIGAGTEEGALPTAAGNNYAQFVTSLKNLYGTIEISDKAIRASEHNEGAFVNLLEDEMQGLLNASSFNFGRMLFGDGSGMLCTVEAVNSDGSVTVDSVKNLAEGMIVDFIDEYDDPLDVKGRKIVGVDRINKKITVSGAEITDDDVPAGSWICIQNSHNLELTGLGKIMATRGVLYGINKADNPWMVPYVQENVGEIDELKIQTAIDALEERAGSKVNMIVCSWGVKRALQKYFSQYKSVIGVTELAGGYTAMTYNGIPVVADRFCPENTMYLLNTEDFCLHQLCDWQWLSGEDGKVIKQLPGKPVYNATLVKYADLVCTRPCGQGMLTGITEL